MNNEATARQSNVQEHKTPSPTRRLKKTPPLGKRAAAKAAMKLNLLLIETIKNCLKCGGTGWAESSDRTTRYLCDCLPVAREKLGLSCEERQP
jgi:hypothetical protein